jgi:hypothetical protein
MNLYEATMIANALAQLEAKAGNYDAAFEGIKT